MIIHCLPVDVFRTHYGDCTNGGISARFNTLLVYCPDGHVTFDSDKETPLNFVAVREIYGVQHIVPARIECNRVSARPGWWMNGGNIANDCDSRFAELKGHYYPLCIHDRQE